MNGIPGQGQIAMAAGDIGAGLLQQWDDALRTPGYYMYAANTLGVTAMNLPKKVQNINFGAVATEHMANPNRYVPITLQEATINGSRGIPDPRGSSARMYNSTMYRNGTPYNLEVLYDSKTNSIWHFTYK